MSAGTKYPTIWRRPLFEEFVAEDEAAIDELALGWLLSLALKVAIGVHFSRTSHRLRDQVLVDL